MQDLGTQLSTGIGYLTPSEIPAMEQAWFKDSLTCFGCFTQCVAFSHLTLGLGYDLTCLETWLS